MTKRLKLHYLLGGGIGALVLGVGLLGGLWWARRPSVAPPAASTKVFQQATFAVYQPSSGSSWWFDGPDAVYDATDGVLTLSLQNGDTTTVLAQQSTPQVFDDVPGHYAKMLATMNQYGEVQTGFGTVALTRPKELNGGQAAVVNKSGTLLFAKPNKDLSDADWAKFFGQLQLVKN